MIVSGRRKMTVALLYRIRIRPGCYKIFQMIRLKWLVISALLCAADTYSQSKWIRVQSPNFEAYSHAGLKFPTWLNEGLADLYSTLRMQGDKALVGDLIPGRLQSLSTEKWVPLSVILSAGQDSPYYNEKSKAGSFYSESWALVHMLS